VAGRFSQLGAVWHPTTNSVQALTSSYAIIPFGRNKPKSYIFYSLKNFFFVSAHGDHVYNTTTTTLPPFNGLFSRTTWVRRHQNGKPFWILLEHETMGWQWHQLDHVQIICTSLQTDNHASISPLSFYRSDALPVTQPTVSKHWSYHLVYMWTCIQDSTI